MICLCFSNQKCLVFASFRCNFDMCISASYTIAIIQSKYYKNWCPNVFDFCKRLKMRKKATVNLQIYF